MSNVLMNVLKNDKFTMFCNIELKLIFKIINEFILIYNYHDKII